MTGSFTIRDGKPEDIGKPITTLTPQVALKTPSIQGYGNSFTPEQQAQYNSMQNMLRQADISSALFQAEIDAIKTGYTAEQLIALRIVEDSLKVIQEKGNSFSDLDSSDKARLKKLDDLAKLLPEKTANSAISKSGIILLGKDKDPYNHGNGSRNTIPYAKIKSWAQEFTPLELLAEAHKCFSRDVIVQRDILKPKSDILRSEAVAADAELAQTIKLHGKLNMKIAKVALGATDEAIQENFNLLSKEFSHGAKSAVLNLLQPGMYDAKGLLSTNLGMACTLKEMLDMKHEDFSKYAKNTGEDPVALRDNLNSALCRIRGNMRSIGTSVLTDTDKIKDALDNLPSSYNAATAYNSAKTRLDLLLDKNLTVQERDCILNMNQTLAKAAEKYPERAEDFKSLMLPEASAEFLQEAFAPKAKQVTNAQDEKARGNTVEMSHA